MNSAKLHATRSIYRNLLLFYTIIMNNHKVKETIPSKEIKYLEINLGKTTEWERLEIYLLKKIKGKQQNGKD